MDADGREQPQCRLVGPGHAQLRRLFASEVEQRACGSRCELFVGRVGRRERQQVGDRCRTAKPLGEFDESPGSGDEARGFVDACRELRIGCVCRRQADHEFGQDHAAFLFGRHECLHEPPQGFEHARLILKIEGSHEPERLARGRRRLGDEVAEQARRVGGAASPGDLPAGRVFPAIAHDCQPGPQPAVPLAGAVEARDAVGADSEGLELPAVARLVTGGEGGPGAVGPLVGNAAERDRALPRHGGRGGRRQPLDEADHVASS